MPFIDPTTAQTFHLHGAQFTALVNPSRGARENCVWLLKLAPGTPAVPHSLTREETFVVTSGQATAVVGGETHVLVAGSALVVPPGVEFSLANPGATPFEAVVVLPVGGQARVGDAPPFTPSWAQ